MHGFIEEIGLTILVATVIGLITQKIRQPIILGYFIAGVILGPEIGKPLISNPDNIEIISEIGLILLLFVIGLEMNISTILKSGKQMLIAAIGQFLLCLVYGFIIFGASGSSFSGPNLHGLYLALLCALSSTAIVVKILYDKFELDTIHGRITVGILIMQDLWAVLILAFQPNFQHIQVGLAGIALLKCAALLGLTFLVSKYLLSKIFAWISKSPELVVGTSLAWCIMCSGLASLLGLSKEMGALVSGVSISAFPYAVFVSAKILPLRDFFLTLFFVSLGMRIPYPTAQILSAAGLLCVFILISRFLSIYPLLSLTGAGRRTAFITSLNLSQLSEFSLVIASIGVAYHHVDRSLMGLLIYTMAFSAILSSYFIQYSHPLFRGFQSLLSRLRLHERRAVEDTAQKETSFPIVILGYHRGARAFIEEISRQKPEVLKRIFVVDFNLEVLREIHAQGLEGMYGDVSHLDTLQHAGIDKARIVLLTIPDMLLKGTSNANLVKVTRTMNPTACIVATADFSAQVQELMKLGANEVLLPYSLAGNVLVQVIAKHIQPILENEE